MANGLVLNRVLSQEVAHLIRAQKKKCWRNAYRAMRELPALFLTSIYTEGWVVIPWDADVFVVEHGWIEHAHDIIDPTIQLQEQVKELLSVDPIRIDCFPGLHLSWLTASTIAPETPFPIIRHLGEDGGEHRGYHAAYTCAVKRALWYAHATNGQVTICPGESRLPVEAPKSTLIVHLPLS